MFELFKLKYRLGKAGYETSWVGWKEFYVYAGRNFATALRNPHTNEPAFDHLSDVKDGELPAIEIARSMGFKPSP